MILKRIKGLVALASVSIAASLSQHVSLPALTADPGLHDASPATSSPIRTVVTVNSNRIDVLAGDEKDVPKVLEKLRELCAGRYASLYPEICEHLDSVAGQELEDLDQTMWWPPADDGGPEFVSTATKSGRHLYHSSRTRQAMITTMSTNIKRPTSTIKATNKATNKATSMMKPTNVITPAMVTVLTTIIILIAVTLNIPTHAIIPTNIIILMGTLLITNTTILRQAPIKPRKQQTRPSGHSLCRHKFCPQRHLRWSSKKSATQPTQVSAQSKPKM
ncbi:hypothetical protein B0T19DRAFT_401702 [Cercophora scortea]|uniref:Uncharacterized protein n=1 Tax=Cercophora scortea TaxID=314031 RepID=A0AAE0IE64_9PEZI|nr:hypothetical protein B0T19DRAFT_401702 [Cercophora scortea]